MQGIAVAVSMTRLKYSATGLTLLASSTTSASYATNSSDEIEVAGGHLYTDFGQVFDAESGSLLGTFYESAMIAASGPTAADTALGKTFVLDNSTQYQYGMYNQN